MGLNNDTITITRKEIEEVFRNKYILTTMASFPLVFSVIIPLIYLFALPSNVTAADVASFKGLVAGSAGMEPRQILVAFIIQSNLSFTS